MDRRYCVKLYCRTWLAPDVVSTVPWDTIITSSNEAGFLRLFKVRPAAQLPPGLPWLNK
jgi:hypothetical protein